MASGVRKVVKSLPYDLMSSMIDFSHLITPVKSFESETYYA